MQDKDKTKYPFFSVIVPTCKRPRQLDCCLGALSALDYPRERFEVIVVNDGGERALEEVVDKFKSLLNIRLLNQENAGPAAARNSGAGQANGTFLAFTDDDCAPAVNWLSAYAQRFSETPECLIGGRISNQRSSNVYATTSQLIIDMVCQLYNRAANRARFFSACNFAVQARLFLDLGGFDPAFRISEDRELCDRWLSRGHQMVYAPEAINYHNDYLASMAGFCKRYFAYGQGAYRYHKIRALRNSGTPQEEVGFHANVGNWLFYPFKHLKGRQAWTASALMTLWQLSNTAGFVWGALKHRYYH